MEPLLVCVDVDGTVVTGSDRRPVPGAAAALRAVRAHVPVRLVTNTTSRSHRQLYERLAALDLVGEPEALVTPAMAARRVLTSRGHDQGLLIVEPDAREDFRWFRETPSGSAVLLGSEAHDRTVADLQPAFRALLRGATLYTLQQNRYFQRDGEMLTDLGPVAAFLSYAADRPVENLGKPSRALFDSLAREAGCPLDRVVMVGDDAEFDASGAVRLGLTGLLVRTGKYRPGDEGRVTPPPTAVLDSIADLPGWIAPQIAG